VAELEGRDMGGLRPTWLARGKLEVSCSNLFSITVTNVIAKASCLMGDLSYGWFSIEQSVPVSGIVHVFLGFVVHNSSCAVELTNYGGPNGE